MKKPATTKPAKTKPVKIEKPEPTSGFREHEITIPEVTMLGEDVLSERNEDEEGW